MADFKTHITTSSVLGVAYGTGAAVAFDVPLDQCLLATGLCSVSDMLPDIDSNHGVPLRESLAFGAAVVPMLLIDRFRNLGFTTDMMVLSGALIYLLIRFAFGHFLRNYTVHRGMFHSIPAAVIFAELTYLICDCAEENLRLFKAAAVFLGFMSHLVLDEFYSLYWYRGRLRKKKSFGTALKLWGPKLWGNISTFSKLALLTYVVFYEGEWMDHWHDHDGHRIADTRAANTPPDFAGQPTEHAHQHGDPAAMQRTWMRQPEAQAPTPVMYDPSVPGGTGYSQPAPQQQQQYNNTPQAAYPTGQQQPAWPQGGYDSNYASGAQTGGYQANSYQAGAYQQNGYQNGGHQQNSYQTGTYQNGGYQQNSYQSGAYQNSQPSSSYPSGNYQGNNYQSNNYQGGQYPSNNNQGGNYPSNSYQGSQYPSGNYQNGAYQNGGYQNHPSGGYQPGSYPSGNYSHGRY